MLGTEPWPSARAVSTLSHRSSLQKSSLFSFVGFLRQNRHSGVLVGCCVLTGQHQASWERPSLTQPLQGQERPMPCISSGRKRWTQSSLLEPLNSNYQKESHAATICWVYLFLHPLDNQISCRMQGLYSRNSYFRHTMGESQCIGPQETLLFLIAVPKHRSSHAGNFITYCSNCSVLLQLSL